MRQLILSLLIALPAFAQDLADIPPQSIINTGVTSVSELLSDPGILDPLHPVDGVPIVYHWLACGDTIDLCNSVVPVLTAQRDFALDSLNMCMNPASGCNVETDFADGPGNALWKPVSDNTRLPVFLLPRGYWEGDMAVMGGDVVDTNGVVLAAVTRRTCCPNGGRAHFDVNVSAAALAASNPITVRLFLANGLTECRTVPNAAQRVD